jgi:metal-sulfur cluster biosynthetic enzyme
MSNRKSKRDPARRQKQKLERRVQSAMTTIYDPATPNIDLFNMGMIYSIEVDDRNVAHIDLAFSSPGHPGNLGLPQQVADTVKELEGINDCKVNVVAEPRWTMDRVSEYARIHMSVVGNQD